MTTFTLTIDTANDAFADDAGPTELARILRKLADGLGDLLDLDEADGTRVRDVNGNTVGTVAVTA